MLSAKQIIEKIQDNKRQIYRFGVKNIGLFGSYARNDQSEKSDMDIIVQFDESKKTFNNYMDLKFFLEELFSCKVDLVILEAIKPDLKIHILDTVIYAA
jgi:uncharacterized protein